MVMSYIHATLNTTDCPDCWPGCVYLPACQRQVQGLASYLQEASSRALEWLYPCCPTSSSAVWSRSMGGGASHCGTDVWEMELQFLGMIMKVLEVFIEKEVYNEFTKRSCLWAIWTYHEVELVLLFQNYMAGSFPPVKAPIHQYLLLSILLS